VESCLRFNRSRFNGFAMTNAERQKAFRERHRNDEHSNVTVNAALWAEAVTRADAAKRYAAKFPSFISNSDQAFQTPDWQYQSLSRHAD
jgi:hypothetical protein